MPEPGLKGGFLEVLDLHVSYGPVSAVRGISLRVSAGALVAVIGANGAGKTSLLAALSGLLRAGKGKILYNGQNVTRWRSHRLIEAGLVHVPEGRDILATLTVEENLQIASWRWRKSAPDQLTDVLDRFPILAERRRLPAGSLSGGEQQMLAIARALLAHPRLLLLDEPSMGLAPKLVDEVFDVILQIRDGGTSVLLVEQNAIRAMQVADYAYAMEIGEIVLEGPARQLMTDQRVIETYLGQSYNRDPHPD